MSIHRQGGFSLIELLAVITIMAILATLAWPHYRQHLTSSRRVLATTCLMQQAHRMERHYAIKQSYLEAPAPLPCGEVDVFYQFGFASPPTETTYVLQAVPQGVQAEHDTRCGTLSINQWGEHSSLAETGAASCW